MVDDVSVGERAHCWHRRQCNCLAAFDDEMVCSYRDATYLHEKRVDNFIIAHPIIVERRNDRSTSTLAPTQIQKERDRG